MVGIFVALFAGVAACAGVFFVRMHREYAVLKAQETTNRRRLEDAQKQLEGQLRYLDQLRHDPVLVERIIRQKLGYAREQEFVFRFDEQK